MVRSFCSPARAGRRSWPRATIGCWTCGTMCRRSRGAFTEDGAVCDTREVFGILSAGSTTLTIQNGALTAADVGRSIVAVGTTSGGVVTQFESAIVSVTDSLHAVLTTPSPFTQAVYHEINLGHDDTAAITKTMNTVGSGGTFVIPAGTCMTQHAACLRVRARLDWGSIEIWSRCRVRTCSRRRIRVWRRA